MYNKLFAKILDSSIWLESKATRIVWITLIAAMDEDGYAHFSAIQNLADRAKVTLEEAEAAVACFMAPDPNSGNPDHDGRRVERVPGGFMVLNGPAHREEITRIIHREKTRLRVAKHRASKRSVTAPVTGSLLKVTPDTDTDTDTAIGKGSAEGKESADRPSVAEVETYAAVIGLAPWKARDWWEEMESCGWLDYQHRAVVKWQPMLTRLKAKWEADGRPSGPPGKAQQSVSEVGRKEESIWAKKVKLDLKQERLDLLKKQGGQDQFGQLTIESHNLEEYQRLRDEVKQLKKEIAR